MVSIILPVYNGEKTIDKCVRSVFGQTYRDWELVIVNDGSQDRTDAICDSLAEQDQRVHVLHKDNGGVVRARAFGLERAAGEYVAFVDSDDTLETDTLEKMVDAARMHSADIVSCGYRETHEDKTAIDFRPKKCGIMNEGEFFPLLFEGGTMGFLCNKLYRRDLLTGVTAPDGMTVCEDLYVNCVLLRQPCKVVVLPDCLYNYYMNPESVTHTIGKKMDHEGRWKYLESYKQILAVVSDIPEYKNRVMDAIPWILKLGMEELIAAGGQERAKAILRKEMRNYFWTCMRTRNSARFKLGYGWRMLQG